MFYAWNLARGVVVDAAVGAALAAAIAHQPLRHLCVNTVTHGGALELRAALVRLAPSLKYLSVASCDERTAGLLRSLLPTTDINFR